MNLAIEAEGPATARLRSRIFTTHPAKRLVPGILEERLIEVDHLCLRHPGVAVGMMPPSARLRAQAAAGEDEPMKLRDPVKRADKAGRTLQASPSWRLTKPLGTFQTALDR